MKTITTLLGILLLTGCLLAADAPAGVPTRDQALKDWEEIVALYRGIGKRLGQLCYNETDVQRYHQDPEGTLAKVDALRAEIPALRAKLDAFAAAYGTTSRDIDRKMDDLAPINLRISRLDPRNQRPDLNAGGCYADLRQNLYFFETATRAQAKTALRQANDLMSFGLVNAQCYAEAETMLKQAQRLSPDDAEIQARLKKLQQERAASAAAVEKAVAAARFPAGAAFSGPGDPAVLKKEAITYFNGVYPKEKAVAAAVAGDWIVTRTNVLGEPMQWGLPVYIASIQNNSPDRCRVFKMTVLTRIALGTAQAPPFTDHWTGDSFVMLQKNLPK